jgi:hypothetical protein
LLQITKEDTVIDDRTLGYEMTSLLETKPESKIMFYRYSKKWHGFLYSIHKEDRLILLKMILEICSYDEYTINIINIQDSQSPIDSSVSISNDNTTKKNLYIKCTIVYFSIIKN